MAEDRQLYTLVVPRDSQTSGTSRRRRNVEGAGAITGGPPSLEAVSLQPGERLVAGQFKGKQAAMNAEEVEQLFASDDLKEVPFFGWDSAAGSRERTKDDGYYVARNVDLNPQDPRTDRFPSFDGALSKAGTPRSHLRRVSVVKSQRDSPFGNGTTLTMAAPAAAERPRWFAPADDATEEATPASTLTGRYGDSDVYDRSASSLSSPHLVYSLPLEEEGKTDCSVYDARGNADKTDTFNGQTYRTWQRVFATEHVFDGDEVVENGHLRLTFDEPNRTLTAERWGGASWSSVSLGASDWQMRECDLVSVGAAEVRAQVDFEDTTQSPTAYYALDMVLPRGRENASWFRPLNEDSPCPSGLVDLLTPVAEGSLVDGGLSKRLVKRSRVRV